MDEFSRESDFLLSQQTIEHDGQYVGRNMNCLAQFFFAYTHHQRICLVEFVDDRNQGTA